MRNNSDDSEGEHYSHRDYSYNSRRDSEPRDSERTAIPPNLYKETIIPGVTLHNINFTDKSANQSMSMRQDNSKQDTLRSQKSNGTTSRVKIGHKNLVVQYNAEIQNEDPPNTSDFEIGLDDLKMKFTPNKE